MVAISSFNRNMSIELEIESILLEKSKWVTPKQMQMLLHQKNIKLCLEHVLEYFNSIHASYMENDYMTVSYEEGKKIMLSKVE